MEVVIVEDPERVEVIVVTADGWIYTSHQDGESMAEARAAPGVLPSSPRVGPRRP
jgi:hypothetical protein